MLFWKITGGLAALFAVYAIWQARELARFETTRYELSSKKLKSGHKWAVLADLHLWRYGKHNERLLRALRREAPEAIFLPGDLIVHTRPERFFVAEELALELTAIAPVYLANGNHESRLENPTHPNYPAYQQLKKKLLELGVHILNNERAILVSGGDEIAVSGLELPLFYYRKGTETPLLPDELTRCLGAADEKRYQVLLAHTPRYTPEYLRWGADLCLSGHYHGGLVRIPGLGSVLSPQFELFPRYSFGRHDEEGRTAIISRGMGTHTFHIRIFNRSELVVVSLNRR